MEPRYLYTIKWMQPYATTYQRPYMNSLQMQLEQIIEHRLEEGGYAEANLVIERIKNASKNN